MFAARFSRMRAMGIGAGMNINYEPIAEKGWDAEKRRREWVRKTISNVCQAITLVLLAAPPSFCATMFLMWAFGKHFIISGDFGDRTMDLEAGIFLVTAAVFCLVGAGGLVKTVVKTRYVPPVAEQIAALPAEEI